MGAFKWNKSRDRIAVFGNNNSLVLAGLPHPLAGLEMKLANGNRLHVHNVHKQSPSVNIGLGRPEETPVSQLYCYPNLHSLGVVEVVTQPAERERAEH